MSFSTTILLMLFIFIIYIVFNNKINFSSKIVLITIFIIAIIYLVSHIDKYKNKSSLVKFEHPGTEPKIINYNDFTSNNKGYSLSMWVYIDDFNYKFGEKKYILSKGKTNTSNNLNIYIEEYKNNIILDFYVPRSVDEENIDNDKANNICIENDKNLDLCVEYDNHTIKYDALEHGIMDTSTCIYDKESKEYKFVTENNLPPLICSEGLYKCSDGYETNVICSNNKNKYSTKLENIPLQKWVNICYVLGNNHVDTYLDGRLINTKTFEGVNIQTKYENYFVSNDGGFSGKLSNLNHHDKILEPTDVWDIYKEGHNSILSKSIINYTNASITFSENNNEKVKYLFI